MLEFLCRSCIGVAGLVPAMQRLPLLHARLDALLAISASHLPLCCYVGLLHCRTRHLLLVHVRGSHLLLLRIRARSSPLR